MSHARTRSARIATVLIALAAITVGPAAGGAHAASAKSVRAEMRAGIIDSVNDIRTQHGCAELKVAKRLNKSAQRHAKDMSITDFFSHTSADGRTWDSRQRAAGWKKPGGENIAYGFDNVDELMTAWMNSPGHRRNIVNCNFRYIGVGYTVTGQYAVQNFGY